MQALHTTVKLVPAQKALKFSGETLNGVAGYLAAGWCINPPPPPSTPLDPAMCVAIVADSGSQAAFNSFVAAFKNTKCYVFGFMNPINITKDGFQNPNPCWNPILSTSAKEESAAQFEWCFNNTLGYCADKTCAISQQLVTECGGDALLAYLTTGVKMAATVVPVAAVVARQAVTDSVAEVASGNLYAVKNVLIAGGIAATMGVTFWAAKKVGDMLSVPEEVVESAATPSAVP